MHQSAAHDQDNAEIKVGGNLDLCEQRKKSDTHRDADMSISDL